MDVVAGSRLVAAVSRAGGFGILGGGYGERIWLEQEIAKLAGMKAPFGIGFITWSLAKRPELLDIALAANPSAIMLSFGDPAPFAASINAYACSDASLFAQSTAVAGTTYLSIRLGGSNVPDLCVGSAGASPSSLAPTTSPRSRSPGQPTPPSGRGASVCSQ